MKSENNKENHKNCQNRGLMAFSESKDSMVGVAIPCYTKENSLRKLL
jgi:hypothetical protein